MTTGSIDANGIWQFGPDDPRVPFDDTLNLGQQSVSTAVGLLKSRTSALESAGSLSTAGSPFSAKPGWTIISQSGYKRSGIAFAYARLQRSGAAITVPTGGNIANQIVATLNAGWSPPPGWSPGLHTNHTGRLAAAYIDAVQDVLISAVAPGPDIATLEEFSLVGSWPLG